MANLIPSIGAKGTYSLRSPYDVLIKDSTYTCVAIRRLSNFVGTAKDPKRLYYDPYQPDDVAWEQDSNDPEVCIVSLRSDSGHVLEIPSTFILSYPNLNGVPYTVKVLAINLGAIPDSLDLSNLYTEIKNLVRDTVGIESEVKSVAISDTKLKSKEDHDALESARVDLIVSSQTERARRLELERQNQALRDNILALETYIKDNLL